ncbi:RES family NAD+ phosphorylase [Azospirillum halopraeferens]|uniref:RES family NAD+ phosphorylase n=1 Tax=Azospirillum halopraeferens TaxID=34010 RepID=UPI0004237746|nr:RES family NAD+ phosphorylase [Azospirillum halopraeferens]
MTAPALPFPRGLKSETIPAGAALVRIHRDDNGPIWFGPGPGAPPAYRFDAPGGEYRTLYAAAALEGAFVETVLRKPKGRILKREFVDRRVWTSLAPTRPLAVAKLYDEGLLWHGTDANVSSSDDYGESRRIALSLYATFTDLDGIAYRARHDNGEICYALFDRVSAAELDPGPSARFRDDPAMVDALMRRYGAVFDTGAPLPPRP